jgi:hypothetical protein
MYQLIYFLVKIIVSFFAHTYLNRNMEGAGSAQSFALVSTL